MIRKPPSDWQPADSRGGETVRAAAQVAKGGLQLARSGGSVVRGLFCYFLAALWGFAGLASGLAGSLPSLIGIGSMAAFMVWLGRRAFARARSTPA